MFYFWKVQSLKQMKQGPAAFGLLTVQMPFGFTWSTGGSGSARLISRSSFCPTMSTISLKKAGSGFGRQVWRRLLCLCRSCKCHRQCTTHRNRISAPLRTPDLTSHPLSSQLKGKKTEERRPAWGAEQRPMLIMKLPLMSLWTGNTEKGSDFERKLGATRDEKVSQTLPSWRCDVETWRSRKRRERKRRKRTDELVRTWSNLKDSFHIYCEDQCMNLKMFPTAVRQWRHRHFEPVTMATKLT